MKRSFVFRSGILLGFVANFTFAADRGDIVDRNGATIVSGSGADRDYPVAEAAAHVTGYCESNEGGQGVVGIEKMANDELARGETVKLNIDLRFQNAVYAQLKESGRSGTAVVIDPRNGEVLALCSYPSYDPKRFTKGISKEGFEELRDAF